MEATPHLNEQWLGLSDAVETARSAQVAVVLQLAQIAHTQAIPEESLVPGAEQVATVGGEGTPPVAEFVIAEVAAILHSSVGSARAQMADALDLCHRHPELWQAMTWGSIEVWQARAVARATRQAGLSLGAARWVDHQAALALKLQPYGRVARQLEGWILQADPEAAAARAEAKRADRHVTLGRLDDGAVALWGQWDAADAVAVDAALDLIADRLARETGAPEPGGPAGRAQLVHRRLRSVALGQLARLALGEPTLLDLAGDTTDAVPSGSQKPRSATLVIHLDHAPIAPVASVERWGAILTEQLRDVLAGIGRITVRPIIDQTRPAATDGYTIPDALRDAVCTHWPVDVFPYGTRPSRACDLDHTVPYDPDGPPGQTSPDNLGPLSRFTHRVKTFARWGLRRFGDDYFEWTSPHGFVYVVTPHGTTMTRRPEPPASLIARSRALNPGLSPQALDALAAPPY